MGFGWRRWLATCGTIVTMLVRWVVPLVACAAVFVATVGSRAESQRKVDVFPGILDEHPAIAYATRTPRDRVARLNERIAAGEITLIHREPAGYLESVLDALEISPESQLLVFSKTGVQRAHTGPTNPRALYFNDSAVVGYIPGAPLIEIASHDPEQGVMFYTIDQTVAPRHSTAASARGAAPSMRADAGGVTPATSMAGSAMLARGDEADSTAQITRRTNCLTCHVSGSTLDVPGMITRSNFVNATGEVIPQLGFHVVDHRTPLAQRWGGWFVTGNYVAPLYGGVGHMGNVMTTLHAERQDVGGTSNELLVRWIDSAAGERGYPSHDSDIVALMLFDHQVRAINLITRLGWETRVARHAGTIDFSSGALRALAEELADYLLFVGEVAPPVRFTPRPGFATTFMAAGPKDSKGRSLRELDLEHRLLRYSCSYMIGSEAFDHLPREARAAVYQQIAGVLSGRDSRPKYSHLSPADRAAISEILTETTPHWSASM